MEKDKNLNVNKVYQQYLKTLVQCGEKLPNWMFFVKFVYDENSKVYVEPETNTIFYGKHATEHSLYHELEHLRSRHKELVIGFDEECERFVKFYFVGFRQGGIEGLFLEEGFNELSARYWFLKANENNPKRKQQAIEEYKSKNYYAFEIYTIVGLCLLLGLNIDEMRNSKYSGDSTGQNIIKNRVTYLTGDDSYWDNMQICLDSFEYAKRMECFEDINLSVRKDALKNYYDLAYKLLYLALERRKIKMSEFNKRMSMLDKYAGKSMIFFTEGKQIAEKCKDKETAIFDSRFTSNHFFMGLNRCFEKFCGLIKFSPAKKSVLEKYSKSVKNLNSEKQQFEESFYGLI